MKEMFMFLNKKISVGASVFLFSAMVTAADSSLVVDAEAENTNAGVHAYLEGRYDDAEQFFLNRTKTAESKNESLIFLGRIAIMRGDTELAVDYVEQALAVGPNSAEEVKISGDVYCNQAQGASIFTALKLAKKCAAQYEAALQIDANNIEALAAAARFYLSAPSIAGGSTKKGTEYLQRLQQLSPEDADTYKINSLEQEGKTDAALQLADELSGKTFRSAINQYEVAHYLRDKKEFAKAKRLFESVSNTPVAVKTKWHIHDSLLQLGEIAIMENDFDKGIEFIERYQSRNKNPKDPHYFWASWSLAKAYKSVGNTEKYALLVNKIKSEGYQKDKAFSKEFEANI